MKPIPRVLFVIAVLTAWITAAATPAAACTTCGTVVKETAASGGIWMILGSLTVFGLNARRMLSALATAARRVFAWTPARRRLATGILSLIVAMSSLSFVAPAQEARAAYPVSSETVTYPAGSIVIDMGVVPQTIDNGLLPYGLIYDLARNNNIPVDWAINDNKVKDGVDFTADGIDFSGGSFIIHADFAPIAAPIIAGWVGPVIHTTVAPFDAPRFETITTWPNTALDAGKGGIAAAYLANAGIPETAYDFVDAGLPYSYTGVPFGTEDQPLNKCIDVYVMPHADPDWEGHQTLLDFNADGGAIWAACHAVSVLEQVDDPFSADPAPDLNFLSNTGVLHFKSPGHDSGDGDYVMATELGFDPIFQFMGKIDSATENGSEQIYLPNEDGWRPTTRVLVWDDNHPDVPVNSPGEAIKLAYGRGFGVETNGFVMYEGGHSHTKGDEADSVAAQRAFLNLHLLAGIERGMKVETDVPETVGSGSTVTVEATISGGAEDYNWTWQSSCGGSFADETGSGAGASVFVSTTFTAPATGGPCSVSLIVNDTCARQSFGASATVVAEEADISIAKTDSVDPVETGSTLTYTLTATNLSAGSTATGVEVIDTLPDGVTFMSATPTTGTASYFNGEVTWDLGSLTNGTPETLTIDVAVDADTFGMITNSATISADQPDPTPGNNSVSEDTVAYGGGLVIDKNADQLFIPSTATPATVNYTFDVTTTSPYPMAGPVTVTDPLCSLPPAYVGGDTNFDTFLDPGETWQFTCSASISVDTTNTATANATDPYLGPVSSAPDSVDVDVFTPGITITKTVVSGATVPEGGLAIFDIEVTNTGDVDLVDVNVTDATVPVCDRSFPVIAAGATLSYSCATTVVDPIPTPLSNTAAVTALDPLGGPVTDDDTANYTVGAADLEVVKTADVTDAEPGDTITFDIEVTNVGIIPMTDVVLTDAMPPGLTWIATLIDVGATAEDDFFTKTNSGGSGWAGNWGGDFQVQQDPVFGGCPGVDCAQRLPKGKKVNRSVDFTGATSATIDFDYRAESLGATESLQVWVDGVLQATFTGPAAEMTYTSETVTVTPVPAGTAIVEFRASNISTELIWVDNVVVNLDGVPAAQDDFFTKTNSGGSGWAGNWGGDFQVQQDPVFGGCPGVDCAQRLPKGKKVNRSVDFTGATSATIDFDYRAESLGATESLQVWVDGVLQATFTGPAAEMTYTSETVTVTPVPAGTAIVEFRASNISTELIWVDNVVVNLDGVPAAQDDFFTKTNSGGSGWAGNWGGDFQVQQDPVFGGCPGVDCAQRLPKGKKVNRSVDFTGATSATIDFDYRAESLGATESLQVWVDGVLQATFTGPAAEMTYTSETVTVTPVPAGTAIVEFRASNISTELIWVDNVVVTKIGSGAGNPAPNLIEATDNVNLAPGETLTVTVVTQVDDPWTDPSQPSVINVAVASSNEQAPVGGISEVPVYDPGISIVKTADSTTVSPGDDVTYTFAVTNEGNQPLDPTVVDPGCAVGPVDVSPADGFNDGDLNTDGLLDYNETWLYTCTFTAGTADFNTTATVTAPHPGGDPDLIATDDEPIDVVNSGIDVTATVDNPIVYAGDYVTWTYTASLAAGTDEPLADVVVTDDSCSPVLPIDVSPADGFNDGDLNLNAMLDVGETFQFDCTTPLAVDTTNTATGEGVDRIDIDRIDTHSDPVNVINPGLDLVKTATPNPQPIAGDPVTFTFDATNTGDDPLNGLSITDDKCSPVTDIDIAPADGFNDGDLNTNGVVDPAETWSFECIDSPLNDITNYADASATDSLGNPVEAFDDVFVDVVTPALEVGKYATAVGDPVTNPSNVSLVLPDIVTYTYKLYNAGDTDLDPDESSFFDDHCPGPFVKVGEIDTVVADAILQPTEAWLYECSAFVGTDTLNLFTASAFNLGIGPAIVSGGDFEFVNLQPQIVISKTADPAAIPAAGATVTYTIRADNIGDETIDLLELIDDVFGDLNGVGTCVVPQTIVGFGFYECEFDQFLSGTAGDSHTNVVTALSEDDEATPTVAVDSATVEYGDGSISGDVLHDVDADGLTTGPIGGVEVTLTWDPDGIPTSGDEVDYTTTTDPSGYYEFVGLPAGEYDVTVTTADLPAGLDTATFDPDGSSDDIAHITLGDGVDLADQDFGYTGEASISGAVLHDVEGDATGDLPLEGITVEATWIGPDGPVVYTTTTATDGSYTFENLPEGDFTVVVDPLGTELAALGIDVPTDDPELPADGIAVITLDGVTTDVSGADFAFTGDNTIDGLVELTDPLGIPLDPIEGVVVDVTWYGPDGLPGGGDDVVYSTTTLADGTYSIPNLPDGNYLVDVDETTLPDGVAVPTVDPEGDLDGDSEVVGLTGGSTVSADFGYTGTSDISGTVFGENPAGADAPLDGVTVTATWAGDGTNGPVVYTTTTDAAGDYSFDALPDGNYTVAVDPLTLPYGFDTQTTDPDVTLDDQTLLPAVSGSVTDVDFGYTGDNTIDGLVELTDPLGIPLDPIEGVVVDVTWYGPDGLPGGGDDVVYSTTTLADGTYSIPNLPDGNYLVDVDETTLPDGVAVPTVDPEGDLDGDSEVVGLTGGSTVSADFGYTGTSDISGTVFGENPAGADAPLDGVTVTATWAGDGTNGPVVYTTTTDAAGDYSFDALPDGNYTVAVDPLTLPYGFDTQTTDPDVTLDDQTLLPAVSGSVTDVDFGYTGDNTIEGTIDFTDLVGTPLVPFPGVGVDVIWYGPDGLPGGGDDVVYSTFTDGAGDYSIPNLPDGNYLVDVDETTIPPGADTPTVDPDVTIDGQHEVLGVGGGSTTTADFGYTGVGVLGGVVDYDLSADGDTADDSPLGDIQVNALWYGPDTFKGTPDDVTYSTTTSATGLYAFSGLADGTYEVTVDPLGTTLPAGMPTNTYDPDGMPGDGETTVVLAGGLPDLDNHFGYSGVNAIDGTIQLTDPFGTPVDPIEGADVEITWYGPDATLGTADDVIQTVSTDGTGGYDLANLPDGNYLVAVDEATLPAGVSAQTIDPEGDDDGDSEIVGLTGGSTATADFGYTGVSEISGTIFGENAAGPDAPLDGVTVTATWAGDGTNGPIVYTTATDANGDYSFTGLPSGDYTVIVDPLTLPYGFDTQTLDPDVTPDSQTVLTGVAGIVGDVDFGYTGDNTIGGLIELTDPSGTPIDPIEGVVVDVTWYGPDGVPSPDDVVYSTTTAADGTYSVPNLPDGNYLVDVDETSLPAGVSVATIDPEGDFDGDSEITGLTGGVPVTADFGYTGDNTIEGTVELTDPSGVPIDPIEGVTVDVVWAGDGTNGPITYTLTTAPDGSYSVDGLADGDYTVTVDPASLPAGVATQTIDPEGDFDGDSEITGLTGGVPVTADFGYTGDNTIEGTVELTDPSGVPIDPIEGVVVEIVWAGDGTNGPITYYATTAPDGSYSVDGLPDGDYTVTVDPASLPAGVSVPTAETDGVPDGTQSITGLTGGVPVTADFGYTGDNTIEGTVELTDPSGVPIDPIEGVTVDVVWAGDGTNGPITYTLTTAPDGSYSVDGLADGDYTVTVDPASLPAGVATQTIDPEGDFDGDSEITGLTGGVPVTADFGYTGDNTIEGTVELTDPSGVPIDPIEGVTVDILWAGDGTNGPLLYSTTTDATGAYSVDGLPDGNYLVAVDPASLPAGVATQTIDPEGDFDGDSEITGLTGGVPVTADFGYTGDNTIEGTVELTDPSGVPIDPIEGVVVEIVWAGDGTNGPITYYATTAPDGSYSVDGLPDGDYTVTVDPASLPAGVSVPTAETDGVPDGTQSITGLTGGVPVTADFGYTGDNTIEGTVELTDPSGVPIDPIEGVTVDVVWAGDGTNGPITYTLTTAPDGSYSVDGLADGDYTVTVDPASLPAGVATQTIDPEGDFDGDSEITGLTGGVPVTADFGYTGDNTIEGTVELTDPSGVPIDPIEGVTVDVVWAGDGTNGPITYYATTAPDGSYSVDGLPDGDYTVTVDPASLPAGVSVPTAETDGVPDGTQSITGLTGGVPVTADFGYTGDAGITGELWFDVNADGIQDPTDPLLEGATVTATWFGPDGIPSVDDIVYSTIVQPDGSYTFAGLPAGDFELAVLLVTLPGGMTDITVEPGIVNLSPAEAVSDADFGVTGTGSSAGDIYFDIDGDGALDAGEIPLRDVPVTLTWEGLDAIDPSDDIVYTAMSDPAGVFLFENLPAGGYTLEIDDASLPAGTTNTEDPDGTLDSTTAFVLAAGEDHAGDRFGYTGGGGATGTLVFDVNGDETLDAGDVGVPGVVVEAVWAGPDGIAGTPDDITYTATTAPDGTYSFGLLPAGDYVVTPDPATLPDGLAATFDPDGAPFESFAMTVPDGVVLTGQDAGYTGTGSLGDQVWFDFNNNGVEDAGEPDFAGVVMTLEFAGFDGVFATGDEFTVTTVTVGGNSYSFTGLPAGNFLLSVDLSTLPANVAETYDLDGGLDSIAVALLPGAAERLDVDFGYTGDASIGTKAWIDTNGDGIVDPTEAGLAGVEVQATWYGQDGIPGTPDDFQLVTTTAADGSYTFPNLPMGDYAIEVLAAAEGYGSTTDTSMTLTLVAGGNFVSGNFGFAPENLPTTGLETSLIARWAVILLVGGALALMAVRRREEEQV